MLNTERVLGRDMLVTSESAASAGPPDPERGRIGGRGGGLFKIYHNRMSINNFPRFAALIPRPGVPALIPQGFPALIPRPPLARLCPSPSRSVLARARGARAHRRRRCRTRTGPGTVPSAPRAAPGTAPPTRSRPLGAHMPGRGQLRQTPAPVRAVCAEVRAVVPACAVRVK